MDIPTIQQGSKSHSGRDSLELRRASRETGRLYEPNHDEVDCPGCGTMFTPKRKCHTMCLACRRKEQRSA